MMLSSFSFIRRFTQLLLLSLVLASASWAGGDDRLNHLLNIDRFEAYLTRLSGVVQGRGKPELAKVLLNITPEELDAMHLDPHALADPSQFDQLALKVTQLKAPTLPVTHEDVTWSYNFFKRKLGEVYRVQNPQIEYTEVKTDPDAVSRTHRAVTPAVNHELTSENIIGLNVESYVSDRTTRGVFWEASEANRKIEYHIGSRRSFLENMAARKVKILGEVKAYARNYNPIFLVQEAGSTDFHYAIAEISGMDRLRHLATQSSVIRWKTPAGDRSPMPPTEVYGSPAANIAAEEAKLTSILKTLPKADKVVIGQKGAFERTFRVLEKRQALLDFAKANPDALPSILSDKDKKFLTKATAEGESTFLASSMKNASDWESLYDKVGKALTEHQLPPLTSSTVFTVDRGSYEFSDYILKGQDGKALRWRIFSNSWGDEVLPIAKALKATGTRDVSYIGTAGGLPNSGLKVGDVAIPSNALDENGVTRKLFTGTVPPGFKTGHTVTHVATPYVETKAWIKGSQPIASLVEVETGYLAQVFKGNKDKLRVFLMVSDVVGSETETLAEPSSSVRRKGQIEIMNTIMSEGGVKGTGKGAPSITYAQNETWANELLPNRDEISKFQLVQKAKFQGITNKEDFAKLIKDEKTFNSVKADTAIIRGNRKLKRILELSEQSGIIPKVSLASDFVEGRWNPANPIGLHFEVHNADEAAKVAQIMHTVKGEDAKLDKLLHVKVETVPPAEGFVRAAHNATELPEVYRDVALRYGGLASTENRSGALKFIKIHSVPAHFETGAVNYFSPDNATANLLKQMQDVENPEEYLKTKVAEFNANAQYEDYEIRTAVVDSIPGGGKAQILPALGEKKIFIDLKITPEGLKNPAVLMEELLHLQQITGLSLPWAPGQQFKTYMNPYQWVETVANAKSGSVQAQEKLARMELEAANASEHAVKYYQDNHLFGSTEPGVVDNYVKKRAEHAKTLYKDVQKAARADLKTRNLAWQEQKKAFDAIEKQTLKLNDLIAKGDRKAVRKMITDYLPWPLMEPSEKRGWNQWLEAMEHPDPSKKVLLFRGLGDDLILRSVEGKPYMMSTVLTHNQGSYTRRLRSLTTLRDKFGAHELRVAASPYNISPDSPTTLSVIMDNHSIEPRGSPFLSLSNYDVGQQFSSGYSHGVSSSRMGAFVIDERRIVANAFARRMYLGEEERLVPLIIFPDEVAVYHDYVANPLPEGVDRKESFLKEVEEKIGRAPTEREIARMAERKDYLQESYANVRDLLLKEEVPVNPNCITPALGALFPL